MVNLITQEPRQISEIATPDFWTSVQVTFLLNFKIGNCLVSSGMYLIYEKSYSHFKVSVYLFLHVNLDLWCVISSESKVGFSCGSFLLKQTKRALEDEQLVIFKSFFIIMLELEKVIPTSSLNVRFLEKFHYLKINNCVAFGIDRGATQFFPIPSGHPKNGKSWDNGRLHLTHE